LVRRCKLFSFYRWLPCKLNLFPTTNASAASLDQQSHGYTQTNLIVALAPFRDRFPIFSELTLELDSREWTPDLSGYPKTDVDLVHDEVHLTAPLLAVEIASPTQNVQDLVEKIAYLLEAGVESSWLVQPTLRIVTVFPDHMNGTTVSDGTVSDPVLDLEIDVGAVSTRTCNLTLHARPP
jgi:Uma2 family endonuclease